MLPTKTELMNKAAHYTDLAGRFDKAIVDEDCMSLLNTANELISYAVITCSYKRIEVPKE